MAISLPKRKRARTRLARGGRNGEDALRRQAERQTLLLEVTSDLIRASEPGELGRMTFDHIKSTFGAVVCTNYRFDPVTRRLTLVFVNGIPPDRLEGARTLELGQEYCGTTAGLLQPLVANKQRICCDPNAGLVRELGATAYACYPLKASDGRLLGTFAVASATREGFSPDDVVWLGTITNFLAQAWERFDAEEGLRASEERFRTSILHSPLPILLFDDREEILALSQSWLEQTGYLREELRRVEDWTARAFGHGSGSVLERFRQIISTEPETQSLELSICTKDGRQRLWSFVFSALGRQSDGRRLFVCIAKDESERKAHEDKVHLLMREINHRSKNMLSLVQAIAHQTATRDPENFIEHFSERIQALSANQDLLVRNEWRGIEIAELTRAQLSHFADLIGSRITMTGPRLRLKTTGAQAVGLALHELATNAGKYGALSTDEGSVDIDWGINGDVFTMNWTERDGPPVESPKRRGFGSVVMKEMAERSVYGTVDLEYTPSGVTWRLTCPTVNALEPCA